MKTVDALVVCGNGKVTVIPIKYKKDGTKIGKFS